MSTTTADDALSSGGASARNPHARVAPNDLFHITGLIHPEATAKVVWDLWISFLIVWSVMEVTYRLGFAKESSASWGDWSNFIDCNFAVDMLLTFTTAYHNYDEAVLVTDRKLVVKNYARGWFIIDFISTIPLDQLLSAAVANASVTRSAKLIRAFRLIRLVKMARLLKMSSMFEEYEDKVPIGPSGMQLLKLLTVMLFLAHLDACAWAAAGLQGRQGANNWVDTYCKTAGPFTECLKDMGPWSQYLAAIYWAITTMTTVGYGDISATHTSAPELIVAIISEIGGCTVLAWLIGNLVGLVQNLDPGERQRKSMVGYLNEYMRDLPMDAADKKSIRRHYAYYLQMRSVFNQTSILHELAPHIAGPTQVFLYRGLLPQLPFICSLEDQITGVLGLIMSRLRPAHYKAEDVIMTSQLQTGDMSFVVRGTARVRISAGGRGPPRKYELKGASHFGEAVVVMPAHIPYSLLAKVTASTATHIMHYSRQAYADLNSLYPHVGNYMLKQLYDPRGTFDWITVLPEHQHEIEALVELASGFAAAGLHSPREGDGRSWSPARSRHRTGAPARNTTGASAEAVSQHTEYQGQMGSMMQAASRKKQW